MPDRAQEAVMSSHAILKPGPSVNAVRGIGGLGDIFAILALMDQVTPPSFNLSVLFPPDSAAEKRTRQFETQSST
jgi:hypothetical protein